MGRIGNLVHRLKPPLLMVVVQFIFAGINLMYKLAANDGMSLRLIVVYRFLFASVIMIPLALIFERKSLEKINRKVVFQAFLCGLFGGSLGQNLYLQSLVHTSATFVAAMINLAPACTFILAICFKMEKLAIRTRAGKAKVCGTLIGIGGAMVFTFYKGIEINMWSTHFNLLKHPRNQPTTSPGTSPASLDTGRFVLGAFFGLLSCISFSMWLITQAKMSVRFPYLCSSTALMCVMGAIQGVVFALCTVRDWSQWRLGWNVRLLAVAYVGIMGSALLVFLISWAVRLMGPLYASIFNPLGLVFVAIVGSLLLDEKLHLGSIIGGIMIVCGVYVVLWGKAKEMKQKTQLVPEPTVDGDSHEAKEEDKQGENKEIDEEDIETPPAIVVA
ncbi:Usually multiple acids move in and out Transporters 24 [Hibiscus trionum]|uniref:WAT1-related protein n=1 Tax=Hibiscus trionum TaxID=183268 RepID=A0A9W7J801_HIBTR|nr:Usually multiple acids move in and out Transporters 24 [Hibiscus trionum]